MEIAEHIDALRQQGESLADAAERAGRDATVPPCAPWLVKDLLRHTGYVHRWAARHVTECPDQIIAGPSEEEILRGGTGDAGLLAWFRAGHAALVHTLATADPAVKCPTFMAAPSPLAFWARRQAHETAIHRADAESASGATPGYEADFAADGTRLRVLAADTGDAWLVEANDGRLQPRRDADGAEQADCTVSGPASGLYLYLWNRANAARAGVTITGDPGLLSAWQASVCVRWD